MLKPLNRNFGGKKIKEAKAELTIVVIDDDKTDAVRKDPTCCVFAQACKRLFKGQAVFYKHVAYIELPDAKGKKYINRYQLTAEASRLVMAYDRTGKFPAGIGIELKPPRKAMQLEVIRKYQETYRLKEASGKVRHEARPRSFDTSVRNGTGSINMSNFHSYDAA